MLIDEGKGCCHPSDRSVVSGRGQPPHHCGTSWPSGTFSAQRGKRLGAPPPCVPCSPMRNTRATPSSKRLTAPACSPTGRCRTTATCPSIMWRVCCPVSWNQRCSTGYRRNWQSGAPSVQLRRRPKLPLDGTAGNTRSPPWWCAVSAEPYTGG